MDFAVLAVHWVKLKKEKREITTKTMQENWKKFLEHESDGYTICNWCTLYSHRRMFTGTGGLENKRTIEDHPNNSIFKICQNTEKSPGDSGEKPSANVGVNNFQYTNTWLYYTY